MHGDKRGAADAPSDTAEPGGPGQASEELGPQPRVGDVGDVGAQERRGYAAVESPSLRRRNDTGGAGDKSSIINWYCLSWAQERGMSMCIYCCVTNYLNTSELKQKRKFTFSHNFYGSVIGE